jgi:hypothetical protein
VKKLLPERQSQLTAVVGRSHTAESSHFVVGPSRIRCIELGMIVEAADELEPIAPEDRGHPAILATKRAIFSF